MKSMTEWAKNNCPCLSAEAGKTGTNEIPSVILEFYPVEMSLCWSLSHTGASTTAESNVSCDYDAKFQPFLLDGNP